MPRTPRATGSTLPVSPSGRCQANVEPAGGWHSRRGPPIGGRGRDRGDRHAEAHPAHPRRGGDACSDLDRGPLEPASLVDRVRDMPGMAGADLARTVTTPDIYEASEIVGPAETSMGRVLADRGVRLRASSETSCACWRRPAWTPPSCPAELPARDVVAGGFDGVLLSNGPGDPAATPYGVAAARRAARPAPAVRDLSGTSAAGPRARRTYLQDALRSPRCEPARPRHANGRGARSPATTTGSR